MYASYYTNYKGKTDTEAFEFCYHWSHGVMSIFRQLRNTCRHVDLWTSQPPPWVRAKRYMPGTVFLLESPRQLLMRVHAATSQQKKQRKTSLFLPFVHTWFCHQRRNSLLRFCPYPNEIVLNPLPPILNRLRLETSYELMIWSLSPRQH